LRQTSEEAIAMLDKLKKLAGQAKEKAGPLAEQAAHKAAELASEAREKAGPLAEQAKERAVDLAGKAAPAVSQGVDKATERLDKATGGRYSSQLDKVQDVVHGTASKVAASAGQSGPAEPTADASSDSSGQEATIITEPPVVVEPPAATIPIAEPPAASTTPVAESAEPAPADTAASKGDSDEEPDGS
jgi:MT0933-like antitoxin protein